MKETVPAPRRATGRAGLGDRDDRIDVSAKNGKGKDVVGHGDTGSADRDYAGSGDADGARRGLHLHLAVDGMQGTGLSSPLMGAAAHAHQRCGPHGGGVQLCVQKPKAGRGPIGSSLRNSPSATVVRPRVTVACPSRRAGQPNSHPILPLGPESPSPPTGGRPNIAAFRSCFRRLQASNCVGQPCWARGRGCFERPAGTRPRSSGRHPFPRSIRCLGCLSLCTGRTLSRSVGSKSVAKESSVNTAYHKFGVTGVKGHRWRPSLPMLRLPPQPSVEGSVSSSADACIWVTAEGSKAASGWQADAI